MRVRREAISDLLSTIRPEANFSDSSDFIQDGLLDSFDLVMLVSSLEKTFGLSIEGKDITPENLCSLDAILKLLAKCGVTE